MADLARIVVVDGQGDLWRRLEPVLRSSGTRAQQVASGPLAIEHLDASPCDLLAGLACAADAEWIAEARRRAPRLALVTCGPREDTEALLRAGADDHLDAGASAEEILHAARKAVARRSPPSHVAARPEMVACGPRMREIVEIIRRVARHPTTVLVTGDSGTGKEVLARAIHAASPRAAGPFVTVSCSAVPEALLESELFGHRKGAFTDASRDRVGRFEEASGGTLFLDEIGDVPLGSQIKLLPVIQEQVVQPLGTNTPVAIDVRLICSTVRDLRADVAAGRFREDLFYRLDVVTIRLPPLAERREDIPALIDLFRGRGNRRMGTRIEGVTQEALRLLREYPWPGNIRELENTIERAMALAEGSRIDVADLPERIRRPRAGRALRLAEDELSVKKGIRHLEEELIRRALDRTGGNRTAAAHLLELSHRALLYKIREFGIDHPARK